MLLMFGCARCVLALLQGLEVVIRAQHGKAAPPDQPPHHAHVIQKLHGENTHSTKNGTAGGTWAVAGPVAPELVAATAARLGGMG